MEMQTSCLEQQNYKHNDQTNNDQFICFFSYMYTHVHVQCTFYYVYGIMIMYKHSQYNYFYQKQVNNGLVILISLKLLMFAKLIVIFLQVHANRRTT